MSITSKEIDFVWKQFDKLNTSSLSDENIELKEIDINICKSCGNTNLCYTNSEISCNNCGIVQTNIFSNTNSNTQPVNNISQVVSTYGKKKSNNKNSKLIQMQEWKIWSNEEKNIYKLTSYTKNLCNNLKIPDVLITSICEIITIIMDAIKKTDGTKRARVKDGIILVCIDYVSKNNGYNFTANELAKKLDLDVKYISKADKMVLDLLNNNKIRLNKENILSTKTPYYYIENVINKKGLKIEYKILELVKKLINICEKNDILLDHTPLSIGVCCFYYILSLFSINIDLKLFSEIYNLSIVTITKTTNKLKRYQSFILKELQLK